jgi:hypothetical protein
MFYVNGTYHVTVRDINKGDIIVLENQSGGRSGIEIQRCFSSRVFYRQIASNGGLDLSKKNGKVLRKTELERYKVQLCSSIDEAEMLVYEEKQDVELLESLEDLYRS